MLMVNGKCKPHYYACESFTTDVDETKCKENIPANGSDKCIWDNSCKTKQKVCNEIDFYFSDCLNLETSDDTNMVCVPTTNGCKEQYRNCEIYNTKAQDKNENDCKSLLIYSEDKNLDGRSKCVFDLETKTCSQENKGCSDFSQYSCSSYIPSNDNKRCIKIGDKCEEIFNT